jgi:hypothetical protein
MFSLFLAPYSFASLEHAKQHETHSSSDHHHDSVIGHHGDPAQGDHSGIGHALAHCGSGACAPSYVGMAINAGTYVAISFRIQLWFGDDALLPSLYLDSDPPVPRGGFSKT